MQPQEIEQLDYVLWKNLKTRVSGLREAPPDTKPEGNTRKGNANKTKG